MAEALVKFFVQRLNSLLVEETETFSGLEDQMDRLVNTLREVGQFTEEMSCEEGDAATCSWVNELRELISEMDDHIDEFIIQMDKQKKSDCLVLTDCFRSELLKIESRLAQAVHRMTELKNPTTVEEMEYSMENPHELEGREEDDRKKSQEGASQIASPKNSATIGGENEDDKDDSQDIGDSQTSALKISTTTGGDEEDKMETSHGVEEGETSDQTFSQFQLVYNKLPYYLQSCFLYCCTFPKDYRIHKGRLIQLLVAEGLVQGKTGEIMEDIAEENINELIIQNMLQEEDDNPNRLSAPYLYRDFCIHKMEKKIFTATCTSPIFIFPRSARRVSIDLDKITITPDLTDLQPRSLFLFGYQDLPEHDRNWLTLPWAKFLRVLDLEGRKIKSLPDEVEYLIHLRYLGLRKTNINQLPAGLGNLRALQTLDLRWCGYFKALPAKIINLAKLRHLKLGPNNSWGTTPSAGIGKLKNLLTLTGIHADYCITRELGNLVQLRKVGIIDVTGENVGEVFASIGNMQGLLCLSLVGKYVNPQQVLVLPDSISPPPTIRKLRLDGLLQKLPQWLGSMKMLTKLRLGFSYLSENPMLVLHLLPNLTRLTLWQAYVSKQLGKEFCRVGWFPKLEFLQIASDVLEEWTEIEKGALPSLNCLHFHCCSKLRMLPEGLQFVTTLKHLYLFPLLDDHMERLKPDGGEENYKIKHISQISFIPTSCCGPSAGWNAGDICVDK
ncbi:hypothetical protein SCA6_003574 [Theobroma cacao]